MSAATTEFKSQIFADFWNCNLHRTIRISRTEEFSTPIVLERISFPNDAATYLDLSDEFLDSIKARVSEVAALAKAKE